MSSLQRLAAITDTTADLIAQLRELQGLRERVRKAELVQRSRQAEPQKKNAHSAALPSPSAALPTARRALI
jgi:hypothetical protein